jgi:hypothetical protein
MELVSFRPFNRSSIYNRIGLQKTDLTDKSLLPCVQNFALLSFVRLPRAKAIAND